jgi:hypothetical protein
MLLTFAGVRTCISEKGFFDLAVADLRWPVDLDAWSLRCHGTDPRCMVADASCPVPSPSLRGGETANVVRLPIDAVGALAVG